MKNRFSFLTSHKALGTIAVVGLSFFAGYKVAQDSPIVAEDIKAAQKILNLNFTDNEIEQLLPNVNRNLNGIQELHAYELDNSTPPAVWFKPQQTGKAIASRQETLRWQLPEKVDLPANRNDLAFYTVAELSVLIRERKISSVELTEFFIERLKKYGDTLQSVITITEETRHGTGTKSR